MIERRCVVCNEVLQRLHLKFGGPKPGKIRWRHLGGYLNRSEQPAHTPKPSPLPSRRDLEAEDRSLRESGQLTDQHEGKQE